MLNKQAPSKVLTVLNIEAVQIGGIGHELLGGSTSKGGIVAVVKTKKLAAGLQTHYGRCKFLEELI